MSEREAEVLAALGEHLSNAQIASRLHLSVRTVETHVSSLLRKLGVADRRALAELAPSLAEAPATEADGGARGVPAEWTPFIGRRRELDELVAGLGSSRLVTLLGPGGVGKTRLAAEVTRQLAPTLPLGATFVELVSTRPGFFVQTVASALGVTERPGQTLLDAVVGPAAARTFAARARQLRAPHRRHGRVPDRAAGRDERPARADDQPHPDRGSRRAGGPAVRALARRAVDRRPVDSEAVALFFDRARTLDAQFDADPAAVGELCAQLDGMPLAIELATARSAALGIAGLRAGLADRLRLLSGGQSGDKRHRSLRAMLDWSHELLDDEERTALAPAGPLRRRRRPRAAAAALIDLPPATVADLVGRLADKSLLVHRPGRARWSLLETVRAYALDKLVEAGELDAVTDRYIGWAIAASARDRGAGSSAVNRGAAEFDAVADDLRAALGVADGESAARLARSLGHLSFARRFLGRSARALRPRRRRDDRPDAGRA